MVQSDLHKEKEILEPTVLTIFGATGDLSADYLIPTIFHMHIEGLLPKDFRLVAVGRRDLTAKTYLDFILKKSAVLKNVTEKQKKAILKFLEYYQGDFEKPESFSGLNEVLSAREKPAHRCYNRLYYFATSPQQFSGIVHILKNFGLLTACAGHKRQVRVLVEKPFGFNLKSAQVLNQLLLKYFSEDQIYRIDHYLGKETVQNLMVVRFANSIFEPLWNRSHIDHIQLSVVYDDTVKNRAEYFDQAGIVRDIVQNHLLQMLVLMTMDEPRELTASHIRDEKLKILNSLRSFTGESLKTDLVRGQYEGYIKDVKNLGSQTETFLAAKMFIDSPRWQDVPIYIKTGMAMKKKITEISVHFKEPVRCLFQGCASNVLTFRIQPDESVRLRLNNKIPGFGIKLHQGEYEFGYKEAFFTEIPPAYERLLLDFMQGDQRLFIRSDEIEAAWKFVDSITEKWQSLPLYKYKKKSSGFSEAEELIKKDLRDWHTKL